MHVGTSLEILERHTARAVPHAHADVGDRIGLAVDLDGDRLAAAVMAIERGDVTREWWSEAVIV